MQRYTAKTLEDAIKEAAEKEYCTVEEIDYLLVSQTEEETTIDVYTIMDVIEYAKEYVQKSIEALGFDNKVNPSLNELTKLAVNNHFKKRFRVLLDVNGYKHDKYGKLVSIARRLAHEVQKTHTDVVLDPMPADERRMIHNALAGMPNIKTESEGFGNKRQIHIKFVD